MPSAPYGMCTEAAVKSYARQSGAQFTQSGLLFTLLLYNQIYYLRVRWTMSPHQVLVSRILGSDPLGTMVSRMRRIEDSVVERLSNFRCICRAWPRFPSRCKAAECRCTRADPNDHQSITTGSLWKKYQSVSQSVAYKSVSYNINFCQWWNQSRVEDWGSMFVTKFQVVFSPITVWHSGWHHIYRRGPPPAGWESCIHPEGLLYHRGEKLCGNLRVTINTDVDVCNEKLHENVEKAIVKLQNLILEKSQIISASFFGPIEAVLEPLNEELTKWGYYLAYHGLQHLFWLDDHRIETTIYHGAESKNHVGK